MAILILVTMTPENRKHTATRADQIARLSRALEAAKGARPARNDGEWAEALSEAIWYAVYDCTYDDVVMRAAAAAKRNGGWGAVYVETAVKERETLLKTRAANIEKFGTLYA